MPKAMAVLGSLAAVMLGAGATPAAPPKLPPASEFTAHVDNPWFPLEPGTRYVSVGVKDGEPARDVMTVTHRTTTIAGAPCRVVDDRLYLSGVLRERTTDWYTQDARGNVWYFGEQTAELDKHGAVTSTSGTWKTGVHGAQPGIFMPAQPTVGRSYRQEFLKGQAEDHFKIVATLGAVKNAIVTHEWTPLEPGTLDSKIYVRGIGTVLELTLKGGNERAELMSVTRARR